LKLIERSYIPTSKFTRHPAGFFYLRKPAYLARFFQHTYLSVPGLLNLSRVHRRLPISYSFFMIFDIGHIFLCPRQSNLAAHPPNTRQGVDMMKHYLSVILTSCLILVGTSVMTANAAEQVYGWQIMTQQERNEYRSHMRSLKTVEERERYRMEHHKMMQERAKERGVSLPEMPGPRKGMGPGSGMGPGNGMGPGKGGGPGKCGANR
jgi:hypothetical protein